LGDKFLNMKDLGGTYLKKSFKFLIQGGFNTETKEIEFSNLAPEKSKNWLWL